MEVGYREGLCEDSQGEAIGGTTRIDKIGWR